MPKGKYGKARRCANNKFGRYCLTQDGSVGLVDIILCQGNVPKTLLFKIDKEIKLPKYYIYNGDRPSIELIHITSENFEKYKEYVNLFNTRNRQLILDMYMDNM